ncbi:MAG: hypothetical protein WCK28_10980 [Burkholderiales bacterium]|jgi:hypothetical protein
MATRPTDAQLYELHAYFAGIAVENYNRHGAVGPSLFAVRLGTDALIGSVVEMDDVMRALQSSDEMRAKFAPVVQAMLAEGGIIREDFRKKGLPLPDLAVHIVESRAADANGDGPRDVVTVGLHSAAGTVLGHCPIEAGTPPRARVEPLDLGTARRDAPSLMPDVPPPATLH